MEEPRVRLSRKIRLIGKRLKMSLADDRTKQLFQSFMPDRKKISNNKSEEIYCVQVFEHLLDFDDFTPELEFEKWAAVEVTNFDHVPEGMETLIIESDWYAVYTHEGLPGEFREQFDKKFYWWYKQALYELENRPHFQVMGDKYKNNDPRSEEDVWIPVKRLDLDK